MWTWSFCPSFVSLSLSFSLRKLQGEMHTRQLMPREAEPHLLHRQQAPTPVWNQPGHSVCTLFLGLGQSSTLALGCWKKRKGPKLNSVSVSTKLYPTNLELACTFFGSLGEGKKQIICLSSPACSSAPYFRRFQGGPKSPSAPPSALRLLDIQITKNWGQAKLLNSFLGPYFGTKVLTQMQRTHFHQEGASRPLAEALFSAL